MSTMQSGHTLPHQMKALRAHKRGGPEQLVYEDAPTPAAPHGADVLVRVAAAAITFDELTWPDTWESHGMGRTPIVPSHEFAGTVIAIGPDVEGLTPGDEIFGLIPFDRDGAAAEYALVPAPSIAVRSSNVSAIKAAAAVLPALTALEALEEQLHVSSGQRLLVRGGTGGVGAFVLQLARQMGIEATATVRSAGSRARALQLGAADVLVGDDADSIPAASFDGAVDAAGAGTPEWLYRAVRPTGRVVMLQEPPVAELAQKYQVDARFFVVSASQSGLQRLGRMLSAGDLEVAVAATYPLEEGRHAYADRSHADRPGKTVLDLTE
jgi:NADPH:quinone reductase-like Zn-dependent oxidoreductase